MTYDDNGNVITKTAPDGTIAQYSYNARNQIVRLEIHDVVQRFTYNENGQLVTETIEGLGTRTYGYTNGRATSVTDFMGNTAAMTYDSYGNLQTLTDFDGNVTTYRYDSAGRVISFTNEEGHTTSTTWAVRRQLLTSTAKWQKVLNIARMGT